MARNFGIAPARCALAGCDVPVVQRSGGGRPRLYCSDAHRAEARRRRLGSTGAVHAGGAPGVAAESDVEGVRGLLYEAVARLEQVQTTAPRDDALVATIRAEATAEILRAQQAAADAARQTAAANDLLVRERGEWQATLEELSRERAEHLGALEELSGALEGARAELEEELLRHHSDVERADSMLQAQRAAQAAETEQVTAELDELRQRLAGALAAAEEAERRARRAEQLLSERTSATVELEVRAARSEEQSRQATVRLEEAKHDLALLRNELATERRHHRAVESELRRRAAKPSPAGAPRARRRTSDAAAARASR
jgi:chromosome segregation ATPase